MFTILIHSAQYCCALLLGIFLAAPQAHAQLGLEQTANEFAISNATTQIRLTCDAGGAWQLSTSVREHDQWKPLFNGRRPLVLGSTFDLSPTTVSVLKNTATIKSLRLQGHQASAGFNWSGEIEAKTDSPLIRFTLNCDLKQPLKLDSPQPIVALWLKQTTATLTLDQGPPSPTGNAFNAPYGYGFPTAYLWDRQREAAVFFNMTPMTWMSHRGLARFSDLQIKTASRDGCIGLGMHPRKLSGDTIAPGPMAIEFYLYSAARAQQPTKFEALATMLKVFAPLHPATSTFPQNTLTGESVSWKSFTQHAISDFMHRDLTYAEIDNGWPDAPLDLVPLPATVKIHPPFIIPDVKKMHRSWMFSTVNHHLTPWLLFSRLQQSSNTLDFALQKANATPRFYDRISGMLTSGMRPPDNNDTHVMELAWQSLVFYQEMSQIKDAMPRASFNPAIAGRLLSGTDDLIRIARHVNYVFSTYFNPITGDPLPFSENKGLGEVREPWSVGSYSYVLLRNYELTQDPRYLQEARTALDTFMHGMRYEAHNQYYHQTFSEPMDMPVMELMGNAYGAVAAWQLLQATGDPHYKAVSRDFLNVLLRMTYWHEDHTTSISAALPRSGLFYPFVGASCATPWETTEANLCIAWLLQHDVDHPLYELLLKLSNTNRINSFSFYPATYAPQVRALHPDLRRDVGQYFPIEELYGLECMGGSVGPRGSALYMAGNAMWNWWMYEALAQADHREIMVLNPATLDSYEAAMQALERHLIVYNPLAESCTFKLKMEYLPTGNYTLLSHDDKNGTQTLRRGTATEFADGHTLTLPPGSKARLELRRENAEPLLAALADRTQTRNLISQAYYVLQAQARAKGPSPALEALRPRFSAAMRHYAENNLPAARAAAGEIVRAVSSTR